jgi:hypothetical protein
MTIERNGRLTGSEGPEDLATQAVLLLDPRLAGVWQFLWEHGEDGGGGGEAAPSPELVATALRMAYVQGYSDALDEGEPGSLYRDLGLRDGFTPDRIGSRRRRRAPARPGSSGM